MKLKIYYTQPSALPSLHSAQHLVQTISTYQANSTPAWESIRFGTMQPIRETGTELSTAI